MAIFNIFKKDTGSAAPAEAKAVKKTEKKETPKEPKKEIKKTVKKEVKKEAEAVAPLKSRKDSEAACRILKWPHVTEKATDLTKVNQYVFNVYESANKPEIKKAVEDVYGAKVVSIKIINIHPKKRRLGKIEGWRKGYKKAIVKLAQGQTIEILPR